jgi:ABC-type uncharacterized transport system auxiliary subunit
MARSRQAKWLAPRFGAAALLFSGCLLGNGSPPPRYFVPESIGADDPQEIVSTQSAATAASLKLGQVSAAAYIGERIVWRSSEVERGIYEQRRWLEPPVHYVERALVQQLFEAGKLRRVESGTVPTVDAELLAFDEILTPIHEAYVELAVSLHDPRDASLYERTLSAHEPIADADPASVARAMGRALDTVVAEAAGEIVARVQPAATNPVRKRHEQGRK